MDTIKVLSTKEILQQFTAKQYPSVQAHIVEYMTQVASHFFIQTDKEWGFSPKFRGFLLNGNPATGKTEMVHQATRAIATLCKQYGLEVKFVMMDAASVNASKFGESEQKLIRYFGTDITDAAHPLYTDAKEKLIYLIDDIDCIFLNRELKLSQEFNYSIDSVIFHQLDAINAHERIVMATSNMRANIDKALDSRLYVIGVPDLKREELNQIVQWNVPDGEIRNLVTAKLDNCVNPTLRDMENAIVSATMGYITKFPLPTVPTELPTFAEVKLLELTKQPACSVTKGDDEMMPFTKIDEGEFTRVIHHLTEGLYQVVSLPTKKQHRYETRQLIVEPSLRFHFK